MASGIIGCMLAINSIINVIALYAVARNSVGATKFSLAAWIFGVVSITLLAIVLLAMIIAGEVIPALSINLLFTPISVLAHMAYGWALLVHLRDLRGQPRNVYGCLVKDGETGAVDTSISISTLTPEDGAIRL